LEITKKDYKKLTQGVRKDLENDGLVGMEYEIAKSLLETTPGLQDFLKKRGVVDTIGRLANDIC